MKVRVAAFTLSVDGFGAGPDQSQAAPLGLRGETLHDWLVHTPTFRELVLGGRAAGPADASTEDTADERFARRSFANVGAWILGRNMFGPVRGPWPDARWKGWWGDNPPYHVPVFVLTHHARAPEPMAGGTVFHFITGGIREALRLATQAAGGKDVRIGGGVHTVRQYLQAGLIDEMHLAIAPRALGQGESLLQGIDLNALGYECIEQEGTRRALHVVFGRQAVATSA
jgi:dihydrofolate reductase